MLPALGLDVDTFLVICAVASVNCVIRSLRALKAVFANASH